MYVLPMLGKIIKYGKNLTKNEENIVQLVLNPFSADSRYVPENRIPVTHSATVTFLMKK